MKAIVMDLDNTLYDATAAYQRGEKAALRLGWINIWMCW